VPARSTTSFSAALKRSAAATRARAPGMFGKSDPFLVIKRRTSEGAFEELLRTEVR
jgi:hypothetical protein